MSRYQIQTKRGSTYEIETDNESDLDGIVAGLELEEANTSRPLPEGVQPANFGAGRGLISQELPTDAPKMSGRRGGTRAEAKPFVGGDERKVAQAKPKASAGELLEQPRDPGMPIPREDLVRQELSPEAEKRRENVEIYQAKASAAPTLRAAPERSATASALDSLNRKPLDNSLFGLAAETGADAARGAIVGVNSIPASIWGGVRAVGDAVGSDTVSGIAKGATDAASEQARQFIGLDQESITRQVFQSTFANVPILLGLGAGNAALAAMGGMSGAQAYTEARDAGKSPDEALERGAFHGVAEVIGERVGLPALASLFAKATAKVSSKELGRAMADMLVRDQVGEQATTALQDAYEKAGRGGLRPDMTLADYLEDAATTAKVSLGQSLLMGGAAAGVKKLQSQPAGLIASATGSAPGQLASAFDRDMADMVAGQAELDAQVRRSLDPTIRAETNFTPSGAPTREAGLTDIVLPLPQAATGDLDVSVPDVSRPVAGGGSPALGADNLGGLVNSGRADAVDVRSGADAGGIVAGAAETRVLGDARGRANPALTDPIQRTSDADLLARVPQEPAQTDGMAPPAADRMPAATTASPAPAAPQAAPDKAAIEAADAALKDATQRSERATKMVAAAQALGEPDTIALAQQVQAESEASLASARQQRASLLQQEIASSRPLPVTGLSSGLDREAGEPSSDGVFADTQSGGYFADGKTALGKSADGLPGNLPGGLKRGEPVGSESSPPQKRSDGVATDAKFLSDLLGRKSFINKGLDGISSKDLLDVQQSMRSRSNDDKILKSVIRLIPVDVMDMLGRQKISAEELFHNPSMLGPVISRAKLDDSVPFVVDPVVSLVRVLAKHAAENSNRLGSGNVGRGSIEFDPAGRAGDGGHSSSDEFEADGISPRLNGNANQSSRSGELTEGWEPFAPETGTKGIPRAEMPQVQAEHRGAMVNFLGARGISQSSEVVPASSLKPTQAEFSPTKAAEAAGRANGRSILVSSDGHILDGHHQWLAASKAGEDVKIIRLDAPIEELITTVKDFPSATTAPATGDTNAAITQSTGPGLDQQPQPPARLAGSTAAQPISAVPVAAGAVDQSARAGTSPSLRGAGSARLDRALRVVESSRARIYGEQSKLKVVDKTTPDEDAAIAFAEANGVSVAIVEETSKSNFNGAAVDGINVLVRGEATDHILSVAVHEGIHTLPADIKTALIGAIKPTLQNKPAFQKLYRYGASPEALAKMTPEQRQADDDMVVEEMVSMLGQSEAKRPEFWQKLGEQMGDTSFGKFARHVLKTLDSMMAKFLAKEGLRRDAWTTDLPLVQNALATAYATNLKRRGLSKDADATLAQFVSQDRVKFTQRAFHGTPHRGIEKFSTEKVGTGEGAQVYGHGLYFAKRKEIAEWYRKTLSDTEYKLDGKLLEDHYETARDEFGAAPGAFLEYAVDNGFRDAIQLARLYAKDKSQRGSFGDDAVDNATDADIQKAIILLGRIERQNTGQLYEVDIPDDEHMLLWDKPLSEQPEVVQKSSRTLKGDIAQDWLEDALDRLNAEWDELTGQDLYKLVQKAMVDDALVPNQGSPAEDALIGGESDKAASMLLLDDGIRGIKYLDGTSRGAGAGTYNYVIFDGSDVNIAAVHYSNRQREHEFEMSTRMPSAVKATEDGMRDLLVADFESAKQDQKWIDATADDFKPENLAGLLSTDRWSVLTAEGPGATKATPAQNAAAMQRLKIDLREAGAKVVPAIGKYGDVQNSLIVTNIDEAKAIELGKRYGQESILTRRGRIYMDGRPDTRAIGIETFDAAPADFYTEIPSTGAFFSVDLDWGVQASNAAKLVDQQDLFPGEFATKRSTVETNIVIDSKGTRAKGGNTNSNSQQITATKQGLKRFWDWFEGSEATDRNGRPLVLYHSTNNDVSQFEINRESTNSYGILGEITVRRAGIFMTPSNKFSQEYLRDGAGQNVMQVYAALMRPLDLRAGLKASDEQELENAGISTRYVRNAQNYWELFDSDDSGTNEFVDGLKAAGYDGAVFTEDSPGGGSSGGETYVAFDPAQIKSATGNVGTFDPSSPDIRFSQSTAQELVEAQMLQKRIKARSNADRAAGLEQISDATLAANKADSERIGQIMRGIEAAKSQPTTPKQPAEPEWLADASEAQQDAIRRMPAWTGDAGFDTRLAKESLNKSAEASFTEYQIAPGIRSVALADLGDLGGYDSPAERKRLDVLVSSLNASKEIEPIFVGIEADGEPYVMEGQHRARAFKAMGMKSIPARVVVDFSEADDVPTNQDIRFANAKFAGQDLPDETRAQKTRRVAQDYFLRTKIVQDVLIGRGANVGEAQDVYRAEERMYGRVQAQLEDFANNWIKPMLKRAADADIDLDELALYAYAHHAPERNAYIDTINPGMGGAGSGMSDADAATIISQVKARPKAALFESLRQDLLAITDTSRQVLLQDGLITQDEFDAWTNAYQDYVPLRGLENVDSEGKVKPGIGRGVNIRGKESVRALGRRSRAGDIIENIVRDYERAVIRGERNNIAKTLLDLVTTNPDPELWEVNARKSNRTFSKTLGLVQTSTAIDSGEETIGVKVGGQQVYIKIKDPLLLRAMKQAAKDETGEFQSMLAQSLGTYNNWLRNTLTRFNPVFGAVNAVRDFQSGAASSLDKIGARGAALYAKHYRAALAASVRNEKQALGKTGALFGDPVMDRYFQEFRAAGGTTGGWFLRDVKDIHTDIRQMMVAGGAAPKNVGERITGSAGWQGAKALLHYVEMFGSASENASRVAAYRAARELGKSPAEAASIAKNLTTNFNRKGEWGTALNSAYLFFNAAVQGSARVLEALKSRKVQALMAGVTGLSAMLALIGAEAGGDDDDGEAYWDKIPDFEKERNLIIMLPPGIRHDGVSEVGTMGRYLKIPMPYGFNVFGVAGYIMSDLARHMRDPRRGLSPAKGAIRMVSAVAGSFNPMGGAFDVTDPTAWGMAVAPTIVDAGIQLSTGVNSFGTPVGPKASPFDSRPDSERFTVSQGGGAAQRLARWANEAAGGNRARSGAIDVMPGTIDNVVSMAGGGAGRFAWDVFVNMPTKLASDDSVHRWRDIPFLRNFSGQVDENVDRGLFYTRMDEALKEAKTAKNEMKLGITVKYDPRSRAMQSIGAAADQYSGLMSDLRKEDLEIVNDGSLTAAEKKVQRKDVELRRNELVREFNKIWYENEGELARGAYDKE